MRHQPAPDDETTGVTDEPASVRRRLGFLMRDSARLMRRRFVQKAREAGLPLNQSEASALVHIAYEPGLRQSLLASRLDIEPIVLVRLLDTLQRAGLIERRTDAGDRRIRTIWLTGMAHPILEQIHSIGAEIRVEALAGLGEAAREQLLDSLVAIRANLTSLTPPASTGQLDDPAVKETLRPQRREAVQ